MHEEEVEHLERSGRYSKTIIPYVLVVTTDQQIHPFGPLVSVWLLVDIKNLDRKEILL